MSIKAGKCTRCKEKKEGRRKWRGGLYCPDCYAWIMKRLERG